jgi:flagellar biosynthesis/type III secretory pathway M-ring protein FliF/YscJ
MDDCYFLDSMDRKTKITCFSITSIVVLVLGVIAMSFGTIEPTEYGILYNSLSKHIDTKNIYEGGL